MSERRDDRRRTAIFVPPRGQAQGESPEVMRPGGSPAADSGPPVDQRSEPQNRWMRRQASSSTSVAVA